MNLAMTITLIVIVSAQVVLSTLTIIKLEKERAKLKKRIDGLEKELDYTIKELSIKSTK